MKKRISILLIWGCVIGLCGCNGELGAEKNPESQKTEFSSETGKSDDGDIDEKSSVTDIIDHFRMEMLETEWSQECFYSDEKYEYCFGYEKSHMVEVIYANGVSENVEEAFSNGHVTIEDLNEYGIQYYRKNKFDITDYSLENYIQCLEGKETIFEEDNYEYYFDRVRSQHVEVTYEDGTKENIKDALASGRINVFDMSQEGIDCFVREKNLTDASKREVVTIVDLCKTGCIATADAIETFYEDQMYTYCFASIESHLKDVYYSDGTRENLVDALEAGHITIKDLNAYDISFWGERKFTIEDRWPDEVIDYEPKEEIIYEGNHYIYYFDVPKSQYVDIVYRDGSRENAIEALKERKITLSDLCDFGIYYNKREK